MIRARSEPARAVPRTGNGRGGWRRAIAPTIVILALGVLVASIYWQTAHFPFVNFDDNHYVTENPHVMKGLSREEVAWAATHFHFGYWHPLTLVSHMIDVELFGSGSPGRHHGTNVLFHLLNSGLLFLLLLRMTGKVREGAIVAALFAVHPLHVESVAWVAERKDVLSAFFWLLTMHAYIDFARMPGKGRYVVVWVSMLAGLLCKPMLVTLPFALLLLDWWPLGRVPHGHCGDRSRSPGRILRGLLLEKVPLFGLSALFGIITVVGQARFGAVRLDDPIPFLPRAANAIVSYAGYLWKVVWPSGLAVLYPHPWTNGGGTPLWKVCAAASFVCGVTWVAFRVRERHPYVFTGWFWYLGTLIPVIGLVQAGNQAMADRFAYIPLIGIYTAGIWLLFDVAETRRLQQTALIAVAVVVLALAWSSRIQTGYWRDSIALFTRATAVTEKNFLAWNNLGAAYAERGKLAEAISYYRKSIEIRPDFPHSWYNLGAAELALGDALRAIPPFREAARLRPANPKAWNSLGVAFARAGQQEPAVECYREAIRLQRNFPGAWYNLGLAYLRMALPLQAVDCFRETLRLQPGYSGAEKKLDEIRGMGGKAFPLTGPVSGEAGRGR